MGVTGLAVLLHRGRNGGIERYADDIVRVSSGSVDWTVIEPSERGSTGFTGTLQDLHQAYAAGGARRPDIIFADRLHVSPQGFAARLGGRRSSLVIGAYGSEIVSPSRRIVKRIAAQRADRILACSKWTAGQVNEILRPSRPATLLHPGIDCAALRMPTSWRRGDFLARLGIDDTSLIILSTARMDRNSRHKGLDRTATAIASLRSSNVDVAWIVVGSGDDDSWVDAQIRRAGVGEATKRVGRLTDEELAMTRWSSDVFCLPGREEIHARGRHVNVEGFGITYIEAAASGLPSVATSIGGAAEAISPGVSGFITDGSPDSIAAGILTVASVPRHQRRASAESWARTFDWSTRGDEVLRALGATEAA